MKNIRIITTFILILFVSLLVSGCAQQSAVDKEATHQPEAQLNQEVNLNLGEEAVVEEEAVEGEVVGEAKIEVEEKKYSIKDYKKWALIFDRYMIDGQSGEGTYYGVSSWGELIDFDYYDKKDCISFNINFFAKGDLLSTIIADTKARKEMDLEVYTPQYVMDLENKIVVKTHQDYNLDFYVSYVCHIGKNKDVVAGYLVERNKDLNGYKKDPDDFRLNFSEDSALILVDDNNAYLHKGMRIVDGQGTGGEIDSCRINDTKNEYFVWSCNRVTEWGKSDNWKVYFNGDISKKYTENIQF